MTMYFDYIFNFSNVFVLPFWGAMILLPNWGLTRKVMASYIPFVVLASLYAYCFVASLDPDSLETFANPTLSQLATVFANEGITTTAWVHFIVMDFFVGRWIYWQGQESQIWTRHSLAICLFAGPLGLLSHIVTIWIAQAIAKPTSDEPTPTS
ncbi:MAG: ABA4-like family protein [Leptolyngbyaceae bacterium]|nr:ABA4-like family protein [Leptolyngbyaceae bacterium]